MIDELPDMRLETPLADMNTPRDPDYIKPEARLAFFVAGYLKQRLCEWEAFLPSVKPFGPNALAMFIAGGSAHKGNCLDTACKYCFGQQADLAHRTIEFFVLRNFIPRDIGGKLQFVPEPATPAAPGGTDGH